MTDRKFPFSDTLFLLRNEECVTFFSKLQSVSEHEEKEATDLLESEFEKERLEFLSENIPYHPESAIWASKIVYFSAQLYVIRENTAKKIDSLFPEFKGNSDTSAKLSADLTLRFLPKIITSLKIADPEDALIKVLENFLQQFHYSAIGYNLVLENINWKEELKDETYRKLYLERIVEKKAYSLAENPYINKLLKTEFGMNKDEFWRELKTDIEENK